MVESNRCHDTEKSSIETREKLRIIVLFHALFNIMNKRVARQAMTNTGNIQAIPSEAYAKKGFQAVDCGLNKVLTADIVRQRKLPTALCSNDAKQCYDRIVHAVANICLQRVGVTDNTCRTMLGTLQQATSCQNSLRYFKNIVRLCTDSPSRRSPRERRGSSHMVAYQCPTDQHAAKTRLGLSFF
jgi:hypothetical protein